MKKMNYKLWLPLMLSFLTGIYACSTSTSLNKKIDAEVKAEPPVATGGPLAASGLAVIQESTTLSAAQKQKLTDLTTKMTSEMVNIRSEEAKLKMVLFKTIVNPKANNREITALKNRIIALDRKKTDKMLSALDEAQKIMGRRDEQDEKFYRAILMDNSEARAQGIN